MATTTELKALITLAGKVDPSLREAMIKASGQTQMLNNSLKKTQSTAGAVFKGVLSAGIVQRAARALWDAGKASIGFASDLEEVQNVVDVTFGKSSADIDSWSKNLMKKFGLSELSAKKYASTLGAMLSSSGISQNVLPEISKQLTELTADMASFYNANPEDMFTKIQSGLSGETEPLKRLGINMSVANLKAFALEKGIKASWDTLDSGSQTLIRMKYLMEKTSNAQGDFARTVGSFANQQKLAKEGLTKVGITLSTKLLPPITQGLIVFNKFLESGTLERLGEKAFYYGKMAYDGFKPLLDLLLGIAKAAGWVIKTVDKALTLGRTTHEKTAYDEYGNYLGEKDKVDSNKYTSYTDPYGKTVYMEKFASGGLADKPSVFGDAGPEMAIPIRPGSRRSLSLLKQTAQMLGTNQDPEVGQDKAIRPGGQRSLFSTDQSAKMHEAKQREREQGNKKESGVVSLVQHFHISGNADAEKVAEKAGSAAKMAIESVFENYFSERERLSYGLA